MSPSMWDREISPSGSEFNQGLGKPRPWFKFRPLGWDISILHGHSWWIVIILHDHVTAFLHGQSQIFFYPKKGYLKDQILRLSYPKAPSKVKRYLATSYYVNDVTERAPRDEYGNVTLMAQRAKQELFCILQLNYCSKGVFLAITRCKLCLHPF